MSRGSSRPMLDEPEASAVADVLETVAELRRASEKALRVREAPPAKLACAIEAERQADAWVVELTQRVQSRARSAAIAENHLLALACDVLDGRRRLPAALLEGDSL